VHLFFSLYITLSSSFLVWLIPFSSIQVNHMSNFGNTSSVSQWQSTTGGTKDDVTLNQNVSTTIQDNDGKTTKTYLHIHINSMHL